MDKLGRQARSAAAAEEAANADIARSTRAIGVFIGRFLPWDARTCARGIQCAKGGTMVHAPIANPQAANKFHTTPGIRHASMRRGNCSPASASSDESHPRQQQHSVDGRGNGLNPAQDEVQVWETKSGKQQAGEERIDDKA